MATIPGIGPIIGTAIAAIVAEPSGFRSGWEFAAWLGLVPPQNSTGGKNPLGGVSKRGNEYLRRLLINGASANLLRATNADPWVIGLRRPELIYKLRRKMLDGCRAGTDPSPSGGAQGVLLGLISASISVRGGRDRPAGHSDANYTEIYALYRNRS